MTQQTIANRYILEHELGAGGMGIVYRGLDTQTNLPVAIKQLKQDRTSSQLLERFKREGEALRALNHPNIVKMWDAVEQDGEQYIVMEYIPGGDLRGLMEKQGKVDYRECVDMALDLADALTRAHRLNIVHRDLKPENVLIDGNGVLHLTDFGVAYLGSKDRMTDPDGIVGTIDYLPPEAFTESVYDTRCDIWAFGIMLFEMIAGAHPFKRDTVAGTLNAILMEPLPDLELIAPDTPIALIDLIYRMLERDPQTRIPSVRIVGGDLEAVLEGRHVARPLPQITSEFESVSTVKQNLPSQTTPFIGREDELVQLAKMIYDPGVRLITLLAPGGMGKTRLALEAASREVSHFPDGTYFIDLAPLSDPDNIVSAIADALHYQFQNDGRSQLQQLCDYLRQKTVLLLLDNYEHLLDGASLATQLLEAAPQLKILVTSRQRLAQPGETLFHLGGLVFPEYEYSEAVLSNAAVQLFLDSGRRAHPTFELTPENTPQIIRICRMVQGMPLGIVLAASWLAVLSPSEIAQEVATSIDFLETQEMTLPERQRSIRAIFEYSWELLSPVEKATFAKLSVFRGGFTRDAAEAVADAKLRTLMTLVNKSFIRREPDSGRYSIHELMRQFGEAHLKADPITESDVRPAHAKFYLTLVKKQEQGLMFGDEQNAIRLIETELNNVYLAWNWSLHQENYSLLEDAVTALGMFRDIDSRFIEFERHYAGAMGVLDVATPAAAVDSLRAELQIWYAWNALRFGQLEQSVARSLGSWRLRQERGLEPRIEPRTPGAISLAILGRIDEARNVAQAMLEYNQERGRGEQIPMFNLGMSYYAMTAVELAAGNYRAVRDYARRGSELFRDVNHRYVRAYMLNNWGDAENALGNADQAKRLFMESFETMKAVGSVEGQASALNSIADIALKQGNIEEARQIYRENLITYEKIGDIGGQAITLARLSHIIADGDDPPAMLLYRALNLVGTSLGSVTFLILLHAAQFFKNHGNPILSRQILFVILSEDAANETVRRQAAELAHQLPVMNQGASSLDELLILVLKELENSQV